MGKAPKDGRVSRRHFIKNGAAVGVAVTSVAGLRAQGVLPGSAPQTDWNQTRDVVVVGAGAAGLPAAIMARDHGASVVVIDENHDIGGHGMLSGGRIPLGGGTSVQKKYGIQDSADQVYLDHTDHRERATKYGDRNLIRVWADENAPTFEFLIENGVTFAEGAPVSVDGATIPRLSITEPFSSDLRDTINGRAGSGLVRHLEASARAKGVEFLLRHKMTNLVREPSAGRVLGITAQAGGRDVHIKATKGVILATGGHTGNVQFRRIFDPRLTDEYQATGEPWSRQSADGEILAMAVGAALWATGNQTCENGRAITKTAHIGCRWGYQNLKWNPESPIFKLAGASGLTVRDFQDVILVNQIGRRFWNELDDSYDFINACLGTNGNLGTDSQANGGGPIWAIFDADAVKREGWVPAPPHIDPNGWFFHGDTIGELAGSIVNPHQFRPIRGSTLEETVATYNSYVGLAKDPAFGRPTPLFRIQTPPFYAAWATPILHDSLTGLRINARCQVIDTHGDVIPGLYCAGESAGGFALHGLPRVIVFGRIAGREAARADA